MQIRPTKTPSSKASTQNEGRKCIQKCLHELRTQFPSVYSVGPCLSRFPPGDCASPALRTSNARAWLRYTRILQRASHDFGSQAQRLWRLEMTRGTPGQDRRATDRTFSRSGNALPRSDLLKSHFQSAKARRTDRKHGHVYVRRRSGA